MAPKPDLMDHGAGSHITHVWSVRKASIEIPSGIFSTREEAEKAARNFQQKYTVHTKNMQSRKLRVIFRHFMLARVLETSQPIKIVRPPAQRATKILRFIFPKKAFDTIFSQIVLDMRDEYFEALAEGATWRARLRHIQLWWLLGTASMKWMAVSSLHKVYEIWKANP